MKMKLRAQRHGTCLYEGVYDIYDAESFGRACANAWTQIQNRVFENATSIGALHDALGDNVVNELDEAEIIIKRVQ